MNGWMDKLGGRGGGIGEWSVGVCWRARGRESSHATRPSGRRIHGDTSSDGATAGRSTHTHAHALQSRIAKLRITSK